MTVELALGTRNQRLTTAQMAGKPPSPFSKFRPANENGTVREEAAKDERLEGILKAWSCFLAQRVRWLGPAPQVEIYEDLEPKINGLAYDETDIQRLIYHISAIEQNEDHAKKAGLFLSALINLGSASRVVLDLRPIPMKLEFLGFRCVKELVIFGDLGSDCALECKNARIRINGNAGHRFGSNSGKSIFKVNGDVGCGVGLKMYACELEIGGDAEHALGEQSIECTIVVNGNAGDAIGSLMLGGSLIVRGNAGNEVGHLCWLGEIIVEGNVLDEAGREMSGGTLIIKGNAGMRVGVVMRCGTIYLEGEYGSLSDLSFQFS